MSPRWAFVSLTLSILILCGKCAYQVPNIEIEPSGNGYNIILPDHSNVVKSVNYILEVNNKCPAIRNHLLASSNGRWILKESVQKNDDVKVSLFVETDNGTLKKYAAKHISEEGMAVDIIGAELPEICRPNADVCKPTETTFMGKKAKCADELLFEETFEKSELNASVWTHEIRLVTNSENHELVAYDDQKENCYIDDGKLNIKATWQEKNVGFDLAERCTSLLETPQYYEQECGYHNKYFTYALPIAFSAKIHTREHVQCKYCRLAARVKFPIGNFLYPYIQLYPKSRFTENAYVDQIRIAARGNKHLESKCGAVQMDGRTVTGEVLYWKKDPRFHTRIERAYRADEHFGSEFHDYVIDWRRNSIQFEVDGLTIGTINTTALSSFNKDEFYVALGLTVGGKFNFPDINYPNAAVISSPALRQMNKFRADKSIRDSWTQPRLEVDYVRLYATEIGK